MSIHAEDLSKLECCLQFYLLPSGEERHRESNSFVESKKEGGKGFLRNSKNPNPDPKRRMWLLLRTHSLPRSDCASIQQNPKADENAAAFSVYRGKKATDGENCPTFRVILTNRRKSHKKPTSIDSPIPTRLLK